MNPSPAPSTREDQLVWQFFDRRPTGFFVDIGANDPKIGSQSWFLEQQGWSGILVEPQSRLCERLRQERPRSHVFQVACGPPGHPPEMPLHIAEKDSKSSLVMNLVEPGTTYVKTELVKILTLDEVLAAEGNPRVDFVSIDVEGTQLDVMRGFTLGRHCPALVLMEDHLHHLRLHRYLCSQGYRLVKRTGLNDWYVPKGRLFKLSTPWERARLWKKVWLNTPFRKLRIRRERRRAAAAR